MSFSYLDGNISLSDSFLEELWNERYGAEFAQKIDNFNYYLREIASLRDDFRSSPSGVIALLLISRFYSFLMHLGEFRAFLTSIFSCSVEKTNELNNWLSIVEGHHRVAYDEYKQMTTHVTIEMVHECLNELIEVNNKQVPVVNETNLESFSELQTAFIPPVHCHVEESKSESELTTNSRNDQMDENNLEFANTDNFYVDTSCMPSIVSVIQESDCLQLSSLYIDNELEPNESLDFADFNLILESPPPIVVSEPILACCDRSLSIEMLEDNQVAIEFPLTIFHDITHNIIPEVRVPAFIDKTSEDTFEIKAENEVYLHTEKNDLCLTYVDPFWENTINAYYRDSANVFQDFSVFFSSQTCRLQSVAFPPLRGQHKAVVAPHFVRVPLGDKIMGVEKHDSLQSFRWDPGIYG